MNARYLVWGWLAASCLLATEAAAQAAGRVLASVGEVTVTRAGRELPLPPGGEVFAGDLVKLGDRSNAQIEFTDGGLVALRMKSEFRIDDYRFSGSESLDRVVLSLLRGGLRTLTGAIGRRQHEGYRVRTPIATVGVRGTHYTLVVCQQDCANADGSLAADGTYGGVFEGRVAIGNEGGVREFGQDEYFFVADIKTPAVPLLGRPGFLRDRLEARQRREQMREQVQAARAEAREEREADLRQFKAALAARLDPRSADAPRNSVTGAVIVGQGTAVAVGDLRDSSGNVAVLGPGLGVSVAFSAGSVRSVTDGGTGTAIVVDGQSGALEQFRLYSGEVAGARNGALITDAGKLAGDGNIHWGRWGPAGDVSLLGSAPFSPPTGVHFVYGALTPPDVLNRAVGTIGVASSAYDHVGGTNPTDGNGQAGQFLGGLFNVDFVARTISGAVSYKIGSVTYTLPVPAGTELQARPGVIGFLVSPRNGGSWSCACNGTSGTLDTYAISGLFMGSRAQGLGVTYATLDQVTGRTAGAAIFRCRNCRP